MQEDFFEIQQFIGSAMVSVAGCVIRISVLKIEYPGFFIVGLAFIAMPLGETLLQPSTFRELEGRQSSASEKQRPYTNKLSD